MASNERVGITLDVLPGTFAGVTAALGGFNELVAATSMFSSAIAKSTSVVDAMTLTLGVGLAGAAWESAKAFGELERGMKIVQAVSGQTSSEISVLTQKANEFSVKYKMGIDDITAGLQTLGRAGLSNVNTQLDTMQAGLQAAKIQGMELNDALEKIVATTALLGGDLKSANFGQQAEKLTSQLLSTAMTAPIDLNDVVQTLSYSGGTAAAAGINIQNDDALYDYLGAISAFAQKGVKGSMAGTAMRAFFTKPASQDTSVVEALGRLDMKASDLWEPGGNAMRPVSEQIELIHKQMDKLHMSTLDQIELWGKIVGPKMGQQMMKLDESTIKETSREIRQTASATELANMTMDNFLSDIATLEQQAQKSWRGYGEAALAWISPVVKGLSGLFNLLGTEVGGFPIFQQFGKMAIILIISKVIQSLGAVKNLFSSIARELYNMLQVGARDTKTVEEQAAAEKKRYEAMGLTKSQAESLVNAESRVTGGLLASKDVLAQFIVKLNEAVTLMSELATLSRATSMNTISTISSAQHNRLYNKGAKDMSTKAWFDQHQGNAGNLTKNEFAQLSLRHGMSESDLLKIYDSKKFQAFAQNQQGKSFAFPTAVSLEKYLQQNQKGLYDPKTNPVMGIVSNIKTDTSAIAQGIKTKPFSQKGDASDATSDLVKKEKSTKSSKKTKKEKAEEELVVETEKESSEKKKQNSKEKENTVEIEKQNALEKELTEIDEWCIQQAQAHAGALNQTVTNVKKHTTEEAVLNTEKLNIVKQDNQAKERGYLSQQRINQLYDEYITYLNNQINKVSGFVSGFNGRYTLRNANRRFGATTYDIDRNQVIPHNKQYVGQLREWQKAASNSDTMGSAQALRNVIQQQKLRQEEALEYVEREVQELSEDVKYIEENKIEQQKIVDKNKQEESVITGNIQTLEATKSLLIEEQNQLRARLQQYKTQYNAYLFNATYGPKSKQVENARKAIALEQSPEYINLKTAYKEKENAIKQTNNEINKEKRLLNQVQTALNKSIIQLNKAIAEDKAIANQKHHLQYAILKETELRNELAMLDDLEIQLSKRTFSAHDREVYILNQKINKHNEHISTLQNILGRYQTEIGEQQQILVAATSARTSLIARGASSKKIEKIDAEIERATRRIANLKNEIIGKETAIKNVVNRRNQAEEELLQKTRTENSIANQLIAGRMAKFTNVMGGFTGLSGSQLNQMQNILRPFGMPSGLSASQLNQIPYVIGQHLNKMMGPSSPLGVQGASRLALAGVPYPYQTSTGFKFVGQSYGPLAGTPFATGQGPYLQLEQTAKTFQTTSTNMEKMFSKSTQLNHNDIMSMYRTGLAQQGGNIQSFINHDRPLKDTRYYGTLDDLNKNVNNIRKYATTTQGVASPYGRYNLPSQYQSATKQLSWLERPNALTNFKNALNGLPAKLQGFGSSLTTATAKTRMASSGPGFWSSMRTGFSANGRYIQGGGIYNWLQMGMTGMVDWGKIKTANASLGTLGKMGNIAGGALGSLGMMFGPAEVAMMGFSMVMQGVQAAQQKYKEELEKINSQLSEARENFEKAEESYLEAYEKENDGKVTQEQKDEALLNLYANGPGDRGDNLDSYRAKVYGALNKIEINTRKKAAKENDFWWGSQGGMQKGFWSHWDETWGWAFDNRNKATKDELNEQFKLAKENAKTTNEDRTLKWTEKSITNANDLEKQYQKYIGMGQGTTYQLDYTLSHYANWIEDMEDYTEQAKYATALMDQDGGIDSTGITGGSELQRTFGKDIDKSYRQFEASLRNIPATVKTQISDSINADPDFYKSMQRQMFTFKDGKLQRIEGKEAKILQAIRHRVGNITEEQAKQTLILSTLSSIHDFVQNQIQPQLLANVESSMSAANTLGLTYTSGGYTGSSTDAVHQGVMTISAQLVSLIEQKALENMSLMAQSTGIDFGDLTDLARASETGLTQELKNKGYDEHDAGQAKGIMSSSMEGMYNGVYMSVGKDQEEAYKLSQDKFKQLFSAKTINGQTFLPELPDMFRTYEKWGVTTLAPFIEEQWAKSLEDTGAEATGAESTDKDKDKDKSKDSTSNKKNWVNLAICNKKEIPKLNVNLFKKPPNFTILNRNFKLRDVNVNTADDAKSIQNAVKNSIIEIQNRSNPKIIQDDAAEYDPINATEGNTIPTGTKKTE